MTPENQAQRVSAVKEILLQDGSTIDVLHWAPEGAGEIRGRALMEMRRLVSEQEPESIELLTTGPGLSAEYAMSAAINTVKSPKLKAALVRVAVKCDLDQGFRSGAVRVLVDSNTVALDLPEFGEQFVVDQYAEAMEENDYHGAYMIARTMMTEGRKVVRSEIPAKDASDAGMESWREKEEVAFGLHAKQVVAGYNAGTILCKDDRISFLFNNFRFRQDGYSSNNINPLAIEVAKAKVRAGLENGQEWFARLDAKEAHLPASYVSELRKQVAPNTTDRLEMWVGEMRQKISGLISRRHNSNQ